MKAQCRAMKMKANLLPHLKCITSEAGNAVCLNSNFSSSRKLVEFKSSPPVLIVHYVTSANTAHFQLRQISSPYIAGNDHAVNVHRFSRDAR